MTEITEDSTDSNGNELKASSSVIDLEMSSLRLIRSECFEPGTFQEPRESGCGALERLNAPSAQVASSRWDSPVVQSLASKASDEFRADPLYTALAEKAEVLQLPLSFVPLIWAVISDGATITAGGAGSSAEAVLASSLNTP